jgi:HPt (histidine-containing phosphotransfer) domain-containing protein
LFVSDHSTSSTNKSTVLFDEAAALDALGGDAELLRIIAVAFIDEAPKQLARLRQAVTEQQADVVRQVAHALKGGVRFFGNTAVYDLAYSLETQGRSGNLNRATESLHELSVLMPELIARLERVVTHSGASSLPPG